MNLRITAIGFGICSCLVSGELVGASAAVKGPEARLKHLLWCRVDVGR